MKPGNKIVSYVVLLSIIFIIIQTAYIVGKNPTFIAQHTDGVLLDEKQFSQSARLSDALAESEYLPQDRMAESQNTEQDAVLAGEKQAWPL